MKKVKEATFTADEIKKVEHKDKVQTIIIDYCHNLNFPHPGDCWEYLIPGSYSAQESP